MINNFDFLFLDFVNDMPILFEDINKIIYDKKLFGCDYQKTLSKLYVYINRLVKRGKLKTFSPGVYYKGTITKEQVIEKKYIKDNNGIKGYLVGESLKYELGVVNDKPEYVDLISNVCYKGSRYKNNTLGVIVHRPRITVNNDNYRYLQLFDLIKLDVSRDIVFKFIKDNKLEMDKIYEYANITRNKRVLERLYIKE